jgi:hypothetical protein
MPDPSQSPDIPFGRSITTGAGWQLTGFFFLALAFQAIVLRFYGQPWICTCGYVALWYGDVLGPGNSQHLTDWYTFSHVIHGFVFYGATSLALPRMPLHCRLCISLGMEVAWELTENTPMIIERYRQQALAAGYTGDSTANSLSDTVTMAVGFFIAWRLPVAVTIAVAIALEVFTLFMIRDNFTLNVINLLYPIPVISQWQAGLHQ